MTDSQLRANVEKIKKLQEEIDALKDASRQEFLAQQQEAAQLLFPDMKLDLVPVEGATPVRRGRPAGSGSRAPRSIESRFMVSLTRLMHSKAIPEVTADRTDSEKMLNDAASRVAEKNGVDVPDGIWKLIDEHLTQHYGEKPKGKKGK